MSLPGNQLVFYRLFYRLTAVPEWREKIPHEISLRLILSWSRHFRDDIAGSLLRLSEFKAYASILQAPSPTRETTLALARALGSARGRTNVAKSCLNKALPSAYGSDKMMTSSKR